MRGSGHGARCGRGTAIGLALLLGACTVGDRAEALFHRQHRALAALTITIDDIQGRQPALADRLYTREEELYSACGPLQTAGQRRLESESIAPDLRWEVYQALDACTRATQEVEHLIRRVHPDAAERYLDAHDPAS